MRLLFLTSEFPYPPESGATIKTASVLDYLRARHDVRALCFARAPLTAEQRRLADERGIQAVLLNRPRSAGNLLRSYLAKVPLSIERNRNPQMARLAEETMAKEQTEALFIDGWLMAQYMPAGFAGLKLLHEHNAEHVLWRRQASLERNPARRLLLEWEYRRVRRYEEAMLRRFDDVFAVSEVDRRALLALGKDLPEILVLPNLPQQELLDRPELSFAETEPLVFYFGTLSWPPNVEGLTFFLRSVWPLVRAGAPEARFVVAGRGAPPQLVRHIEGADGVGFAGGIEDAEPFYRRARVFVDTTHSGGGTKIKILNALARGLSIVATPEATEGIEAITGEHLLIAEGDEAIAQAVLRLLEDGELWTALSHAGRSLIGDRYVPQVAYAVLNRAMMAG